jgi:hypothetical protein
MTGGRNTEKRPRTDLRAIHGFQCQGKPGAAVDAIVKKEELTMSTRIVGGTLLAIACATLAWAHTVPKDKQDQTQVFFGSLNKFENPGEISFSDIVSQTPEAERIREDDVKRGSGEYWILMQKATSRARRAVASYAKDAGYDLVTESGYLSSVVEEATPTDITADVIEKLGA